MLDDVAYKNGQKNNWRRKVWNNVVDLQRSYGANVADDIVLYLPAEKDLDRIVATQKGFRDYNMIAVEKNPKIVKVLRSRGVIVINESIEKVMAVWPSHTKVSVILADFQCGLEWCVEQLLVFYAFRDAFRDATLCINLQRGRENSPSRINMLRYNPALRDIDGGKHRGVQTMYMLASILTRLGLLTESNAKDFNEWYRYGGFYTYVSSRVKMDSVIIKGLSAPYAKETYISMTEGVRSEGDADEEYLESLEAARRKVTAALAVRTMKFN